MTAASIQAAVLIPLLETSQGTRVLLTVRSQLVEHHKGQISFPGGVKDDTDSDLAHTALRETEEEIGLSANRIEIVDRLEPVHTVSSGFLVTPYIGRVKDADDLLMGNGLRLSPFEIHEAIFPPLSFFTEPVNTRWEYFQRGDTTDRVKLPYYDFEGHRIWGATAVMIAKFLQRLGEP